MRKKIFLNFLSILTIIFVLIGFSSFFFLSSIYHNEVNSKLMVVLRLAKQELEHSNDYNKILSAYKQIPDVRVTVIDKTGNVLYETNANTNHMNNHLNRDEVQEALQTGQGYAQRRSSTTNEVYKYAAIPISNGRILRVAMPVNILSRNFYYLIFVFLITGIILFMICTILIFQFTKGIVRPVKNITNYAKAEGKIKLDKTNMTDEILVLANSLEDMTEKIENQIKDIRKLEKVRSEFVSNVTHELKTPLTSIMGFVEILKKGAINDKEAATRFLDIINIEAERLQKLIEDVLTLSHIESTKVEEDLALFDFKEVVDDVIALTKQACLEKNIKLKVKAQDPIFVFANLYRMKQILINLISNAIKYNKPNGEITILTEKEGKNLILTVSDTGVGMPQDQLERIFERFYRVDKGRSTEQGSTGLGLSIVKHIVERYNGKITVRSEINNGSSFKVILPIIEE